MEALQMSQEKKSHDRSRLYFSGVIEDPEKNPLDKLTCRNPEINLDKRQPRMVKKLTIMKNLSVTGNPDENRQG